MIRPHRQLLVALAISLVLFNVPYGEYVLYPFKLFATWLHESGHGLMALLCGEDFDRMEIRADTSGTAYHFGDGGRLVKALITSAGYVGTTLFGALLLLVGSGSEKRSRLALVALAAWMLVFDLMFVRNLFGVFAVGAMGASIAMVAWKAPASASAALLNLIAAQSCINALLDIRVLFAIGDSTVPGQGQSDAAAMQHQLLLPYWFWAASWMALSVAVLAASLWTKA